MLVSTLAVINVARNTCDEDCIHDFVSLSLRPEAEGGLCLINWGCFILLIRDILNNEQFSDVNIYVKKFVVNDVTIHVTIIT